MSCQHAANQLYFEIWHKFKILLLLNLNCTITGIKLRNLELFRITEPNKKNNYFDKKVYCIQFNCQLIFNHRFGYFYLIIKFLVINIFNYNFNKIIFIIINSINIVKNIKFINFIKIVKIL